ncbi:hypothetical protein [Geitlerinema sp. P-1104]|uniref:hypothetical protein n=1 Tax=Geitlerinema sp. P-1104 TaxID=2546230 RepID=UPI0019808CDA|nr:hypothetical protein [Geitlerinema sp. P-1104]
MNLSRYLALFELNQQIFPVPGGKLAKADNYDLRYFFLISEKNDPLSCKMLRNGQLFSDPLHLHLSQVFK